MNLRSVAALALAAAATIVPQRASAWHDEPFDPPTVTLTHAAPLPCSMVCSYMNPAAGGDAACNDLFPAASVDRSTLRITGLGVVEIQSLMNLEWDTFICSDTVPSQNYGICLLCYWCEGRGGLTDCTESWSLTRQGVLDWNGGESDRFHIVSYNWLDLDPATIRVWGPAEVVDDAHEATLP